MTSMPLLRITSRWDCFATEQYGRAYYFVKLATVVRQATAKPRTPSWRAAKSNAQQGFEIEAEEPHEVLVGGRVIVVFAVFPDELCATLIENAGQEDGAAKAGTHAPRRALVKSVCAIGVFM